MEVSSKGNVTELKCFLKCVESGFIISKPVFDNARYDFLLDSGTKIYKIQVKTSHWRNEEHTCFEFNGYSQHSVGKGNKRMKYTNKEIDFFMTEKDGWFYLYPAQECGFVAKTLRVIPPKSGQFKNIEYAKDFLFEEISKSL